VERPSVEALEHQRILERLWQPPFADQPGELLLDSTGNPATVAGGKAVQYEFLDMDLNRVSSRQAFFGLYRSLHGTFSTP
jgi:hypothetical protein